MSADRAPQLKAGVRLLSEFKGAMKRLKKVQWLYLSVAITMVTFLGWFFSSGIQLQPRRPQNASGWQEIHSGDVTYIGWFVLENGESTQNRKIGVKLIGISSTPCPFATICMQPQAKATLRFYNPVDQSTICEATLDSSSTGYDTKRVCAGLPFTNIDVREINTRENWALVLLYNL
jgi:hypothetical protein